MELFKPEFGLVFWMFVAFLCLFFILAKYVWPFIIKSMDERAVLIDNGVAYAEEAKSQLDNAKAEAGKLIAEAQRKQADILRDADKMKTQIIEEARQGARQAAQTEAENAKLLIEQARKESELQLKQNVGAFALQIAEQVIRQNMSDDATQRALVGKLLNEVENKN